MRERYEFEHGFLRVIDDELGLHLETPFNYEGESKTFYPSGKLKSVCYYKDLDLHGPSFFYSEEGMLLSQSWFFFGKQQGKMKQYYSSGKIYSLQQFKDGKREGKQEYYFEEGGLKSFMFYHNGTLHGETLLYHPTGKLKRKTCFSNGAKTGEDKIWDEEGKECPVC
jgi:antitoxin component YwqK of YwqJK toxin-antitoxin module